MGASNPALLNCPLQNAMMRAGYGQEQRNPK
jgi:hypothetical protein